MTPTTLVVGGAYAAREAAIAAALHEGEAAVVILEGLPDGKSTSPLQQALAPSQLIRIAPGCVCCTGSLTMRVTLNRVLRRAPQRLFISLASDAHLAQIRQFLFAPDYLQLLGLTDDLRIPS